MVTIVSMEFKDWLLNKMNELSISQADLARSSGLTTGAISNYINGRKPDNSSITKIAKGLKLPLEVVYQAAGVLPPSNNTSLSARKLYLLQLVAEADENGVEHGIASLETSRKLKK